MSTIEERTAYLNNPFFTKHLYGDFSPFYITIAVCTTIGVLLILLNIICGCCSEYADYWQDRFTGNRWLVSLWSATPHKQPPLDFTELKTAEELYQLRHQVIEIEPSEHVVRPAQQRPLRSELIRGLHKAQAQREEQVELQKQESDI